MSLARSLSRATLVHGFNDIIAPWVAERCDNVNYGFAGEIYTIGVLLHNHIIAGFVYTNWQPRYGTIQMSLAADNPKWGTRKNIHEILAYPFMTRDCQRITVLINENNKPGLRLATGVGFEQESIAEREYGNDNAIVLKLFREGWEAGKYGKKR